MQKEKYTRFIKEKAKELGFDFCGISKAEFLEKEAPLLDIWLKKNYNGKMAYMANHFDKRLDPRLLVEGAKSVITFILNYFPEEKKSEEKEDIKISKYAYGTDYHFVIKDKLKELFAAMTVEIGEINGRVFVDSAPVMDKVWAKKSGVGWIGKHSNLINRNIGSFFFIGEIICDLELEYDGPIKDYCGTCTACLDACPTDAIVDAYVVDGSKCISYLTIELKEQIPAEFKGKMENWAFGCDICQDVCPWNRFTKPHSIQEFKMNDDLKKLGDWEEITEEIFNSVFKNSALKRTKFEGLKRNIEFLKPI
ncbi:tRNA epoxyqueuosine(34) reductase QueG [Lacihabitans sp. LS3-19]|uniref:tRNA epoxyqueuosine(34) reductase QueG n=1 Tax=Lacihabitans sp. LS3-19 TaxID=2487335 RepID=UPI0020CF9C4F|nr:tRNA epoxyqueuosine(34) reductase QueG [Lacihabitans sp. LS3-19]MCP9769915.1 tRNA epoxyqueuosine(34) reductase QueG [Lacihabitans sp. LS3-19]